MVALGVCVVIGIAACIISIYFPDGIFYSKYGIRTSGAHRKLLNPQLFCSVISQIELTLKRKETRGATRLVLMIYVHDHETKASLYGWESL